MKYISHTIVLFLLNSGITLSAFAQTDSTYSKPIDLQKAFQETVKKYEYFETEHGHYIQTPNVVMHYLTWGKPTGIPFVWVHGTTSNGYEASGFAENLEKDGFYVISIDYYGHGKTPFPTKEVSIYDVADDIKYLLDKLKINKAIIGGWSRGGSIATSFYDEYPETVLGIVLEDGGSVAWTRPYFKLDQKEMLQKLSEEAEKHGPVASQQMYNSLFDAFCNYQRKGNITLTTFHSINESSKGQWTINPGLAKWLGEDSWEIMTNYILRPTEAPLFEYSTMMIEPKIVYRNLQVPLLIFDAIDNEDAFKDFEKNNRLLKQNHPKWVTHLVYENTRHAIKYQHPERFYKDLISFLNGIKNSGK